MSVSVGDRAPDFALPSSSGGLWRLSDFLGKAPVVLSFYVKNGTPVCHRQVCALRDNLRELQQHGAEVVAISPDTIDSQREYASKLHVPYGLLSDEAGAVRKLYGISKKFGVLPGRVTFLIDREGVVRLAFDSWLDGPAHALAALQAMTKGNEANAR